jgi:hypothetical protein
METFHVTCRLACGLAHFCEQDGIGAVRPWIKPRCRCESAIARTLGRASAIADLRAVAKRKAEASARCIACKACSCESTSDDVSTVRCIAIRRRFLWRRNLGAWISCTIALAAGRPFRVLTSVDQWIRQSDARGRLVRCRDHRDRARNVSRHPKQTIECIGDRLAAQGNFAIFCERSRLRSASDPSSRPEGRDALEPRPCA